MTDRLSPERIGELTCGHSIFDAHIDCVLCLRFALEQAVKAATKSAQDISKLEAHISSLEAGVAEARNKVRATVATPEAGGSAGFDDYWNKTFWEGIRQSGEEGSYKEHRETWQAATAVAATRQADLKAPGPCGHPKACLVEQKHRVMVTKEDDTVHSVPTFHCSACEREAEAVGDALVAAAQTFEKLRYNLDVLTMQHPERKLDGQTWNEAMQFAAQTLRALKPTIAASRERRENNYVAWLRYVGGTIKACDSDAEGAFKVWR
jgi:hypothetical protein